MGDADITHSMNNNTEGAREASDRCQGPAFSTLVCWVSDMRNGMDIRSDGRS